MSPIHRCRPLLGTFVTIQINDPYGTAGQELIANAFALIENVDFEASFFRQDNWLSRYNRRTLKSDLDRPVWMPKLLQLCDEMSQLSHGAFLPQTNGLLDLSGIAKGYAVDLAVDYLQYEGVSGGVVNAGGDLRVFGDESQDVILVSPIDNRELETVTLTNSAIATSISNLNELPIDSMERLASSGIRLHRSQKTTTAPRLISVIAPRCAVSDALTKVVAHHDADFTALLGRYRARAIAFDLNAMDRREIIGC